MKKFPLIVDVETQHSFRERPNVEDLKVSVAVIYDYADNKLKTFFETELGDLFKIFENASYLIGFNSRSFDIPALAPYYFGNASQFAQFDMLEDIREKIGRRIGLNDLVDATLGKGKSGHGLQAIELYREGKLEELAQYCGDDVMLTKELFDYGIENKMVYYKTEKGKTPIFVSWKKYLEDNGASETSLTLPF